MEVILLENIGNLGALGDKVDVKAGFGRNYLIPQGKAVPATGDNIAQFEARRAELEAAAAAALTAAQGRADAINGLGLVSIPANAGEEGKLFGSVTASDISEALAEKGLEVDRHLIRLEEPIKQLGVYRVTVRLHAEVRPEVTVWVVAEGDTEG